MQAHSYYSMSVLGYLYVTEAYIICCEVMLYMSFVCQQAASSGRGGDERATGGAFKRTNGRECAPVGAGSPYSKGARVARAVASDGCVVICQMPGRCTSYVTINCS
jgi:hypothetical protein